MHNVLRSITKLTVSYRLNAMPNLKTLVLDAQHALDQIQPVSLADNRKKEAQVKGTYWFLLVLSPRHDC